MNSAVVLWRWLPAFKMRRSAGNEKPEEKELETLGE
jgi:hypothetical protein